MYAKSEASAEKIYKSLLGVSGAFKVYRRAKMPEHLHYASNPRIGDPVVVPTGPYRLVVSTFPPRSVCVPPHGEHGYDPRKMPAMKAIFYAAGPDIRSGITVDPFET